MSDISAVPFSCIVMVKGIELCFRLNLSSLFAGVVLCTCLSPPHSPTSSSASASHSVQGWREDESFISQRKKCESLEWGAEQRSLISIVILNLSVAEIRSLFLGCLHEWEDACVLWEIGRKWSKREGRKCGGEGNAEGPEVVESDSLLVMSLLLTPLSVMNKYRT